jgi:hypothetical protein
MAASFLLRPEVVDFLAMRALLVLLQALTVAMVITGCSGPGSVQLKPPAAPIASQPRVGCDQTIQQKGAPGGRTVLGVLAVPPAHLQKAVPAGSRPWRYFRKYGLAIRAGSPAVVITVPAAWRHRAAIGWGNKIGVVSSLRLLSCPRQLGAWNGYAGGFYLRSATGCVPLSVEIGQRTATLRFAIGRSCSSAG